MCAIATKEYVTIDSLREVKLDGACSFQSSLIRPGTQKRRSKSGARHQHAER